MLYFRYERINDMKITEAKEKTKGIISLIILAVIYGGSGVIVRYLNLYLTDFQNIYIRTFLALILGLLIFRKSLNFEKLRKITFSEWLLLLIRSAATFPLAIVLWVKATSLTKLANISFIDSLPLTATLSFIFLREKTTLPKLYWLGLSFVGVILVAVEDFSNIFTFGMGELLVLASGFFFAFRNISRRWHTNLLNDAEMTQIMFFFGLIMVFILSLIFGEKINIPAFNWELFLMLIFGGLVLVANIFISNYGFARVPAVFGSNILNMEAFFAIYFGLLFYKEMPNIKELLGGAMIVLSVIMMSRLKE